MMSHLAEELDLSFGCLQQGNESIPLHPLIESIVFEGHEPEARFQKRLERRNLAQT